MCGLTRWMSSHKLLLHGTGPFGRIITFVPCSGRKLSANFAFLAAGASELLLTMMGSGTGTLSSWWTSESSRFRNNGVSKSSFSLTILSGNPFRTNCSAFDMRESLYSCTCNTLPHALELALSRVSQPYTPSLRWRPP